MNGTVEPAIQEQLGFNEQVLWSGRPPHGVLFRTSDLALIPFSLLWGGFAVFWEYSVVSSKGAPFFFILWGVPFVGMGLYLIVGRFFVDALQRARTSYGVTTQRVIIVSGLRRKKVTSLQLRTLPDLSLEEGSGGRGTISFGGMYGIPAWSRSGMAWPGLPSPPSFELIEEPKTVFEIIRRAQT